MHCNISNDKIASHGPPPAPRIPPRPVPSYLPRIQGQVSPLANQRSMLWLVAMVSPSYSDASEFRVRACTTTFQQASQPTSHQLESLAQSVCYTFNSWIRRLHRGCKPIWHIKKGKNHRSRPLLMHQTSPQPNKHGRKQLRIQWRVKSFSLFKAPWHGPDPFRFTH